MARREIVDYSRADLCPDISTAQEFFSLNDWESVPSSIRRALRRRVFAKDLGHCRIRGPHCKHRPGCRGCAEELDHIIPVEEDGPLLDPDNHRSACRPCNRHRDRPTLRSVAGASRRW